MNLEKFIESAVWMQPVKIFLSFNCQTPVQKHYSHICFTSVYDEVLQSVE